MELTFEELSKGQVEVLEVPPDASAPPKHIQSNLHKKKIQSNLHEIIQSNLHQIVRKHPQEMSTQPLT